MTSSHQDAVPCQWFSHLAASLDRKVVLGLLAVHRAWGVIALLLLARMYVRAKDLPAIYPQHRPEFQTKLEMGVELLRWSHSWLRPGQQPREKPTTSPRVIGLSDSGRAAPMPAPSWAHRDSPVLSISAAPGDAFLAYPNQMFFDRIWNLGHLDFRRNE